MKAHFINTHLVPRSRSSAKVKVKYQGHVSQKMGVSGALVFHKHTLFNYQKGNIQQVHSQPGADAQMLCSYASNRFVEDPVPSYLQF